MRNAKLTNAMVEEFTRLYSELIEGFTLCDERADSIDRRLHMLESKVSELDTQLGIVKSYLVEDSCGDC